MRKKRAALAVIIAAIVAIGVGGATLLQTKPEVPKNGGTVIANTTDLDQKTMLNVVSARSAFPLVQYWALQYNNDEKALGSVQLSYYLERPDVPSDLKVIGDIRQASNASYNIPVSAQAVVLVYNIPSFPDIPSGMKLNSTVLSSILNGTITQWNDPAIRDLNHELNLPAEKIIVVHGNGNSSGTDLLDKYVYTNIRWSESSIGVLGPDEIASTVRKTPFSIGYVDFSYATQTRMTFAALANLHGEYVLPSTDSIWHAVNSSLLVQNITDVNQTAGLAPPLMNASMLDNSSYPITGLYYASFPDNMPQATKNATVDFVGWIISSGQQTLSEVQYPSIYQDNKPLTNYAGAIINSTTTITTKP